VKIIAGLGNPGEKYVESRHNIGYKVIDLLAKEYRVKFFNQLNKLIKIAETRICGQVVCFIKPLTFMNVSGLPISQFIEFRNISLDQFLLVYDDIDLSIGQVKIKPSGSSGGHRGVESIIKYLENKNFPRVRIGIGHPGDPELIAKHVLSSVKDKQQIKQLEKCIIIAKEAIKLWIKDDIEKVMSKFN